MSITIKDVAKEAGVSASTVSRVISDDRSISDKTKERVREVMMQLKYYPNMNARRLVNQRTNVIGLILPNNTDNFFQNPFFPTVLRGISEISSENQYSLLLYTAHTEEERLDHVKQLVFGKQVDGLILLYSKRNDVIVDFLVENQFPFVIVGSPMRDEVHSVDNDNEFISRQATNHLIGLGARKIAFVGGDTDQDFVQLRFAGYKRALEGYGIPVNESQIFNDFEFLSSSGYELARQLSRISHLDGIIVADELVARGIKEGWQQCQQKVLPIVTFKAYNTKDNMQSSDIFVNINAQYLGQQAMIILLKIVSKTNHNQEIYREIVSSELVK